MRFDRHILPVVLLVASLAYTLWFVFAGFGNHQDPLYWLYKYEHLEGGWMAVGSLLTGGAIVRFFGAQLLPLRLFGWLCTVTAIALPYICLLDKQQRKENLHWLAFTYLLMGYGTFQEFSPGTLSVLLLSAIWVCTVNSQLSTINYQLSTINSQLSTITAILLGLAVTARFPNILVLLILIPIWKKRALWCIPIAALTAGVVYGVGWLCITPAPMDSAMTSHDLMEMVTGLWENGARLVLYLLVAIGALMLGKIEIPVLKRYQPIVLGLIAGLALTYCIVFTTRPTQWYNIDMTYMVSAMVLVIALFPSVVRRESIVAIGAAFMVIATLGTDTAWLKLFPAVLCLLPLAVTHYSIEGRQFLITALSVVTCLVMVRMTTNSIGQSNLTKADTFCSVAPYQGIAIRSAEQQRLQQYKADFDSLQSPITNHQSPILSIGQECHLMRAVTGCEAAKYNEFWSNIFDSVYTEKYQAVIEREHPIVFCSYSPQFKTKPIYLDQQSALERMLLDHGYTPLDRSKYKYMIYLPAYEQEIR